jgi:hypothetical protein
MLTIYSKIIYTHECWGGVWWEGRSRVWMYYFELYSPSIKHSTGTLEFVQKAMPGAKRATEPRGGPSSVTPKNAS